MTDVPWTTLEPGTTEKVISVMLCRREPAARRIRPSSGDGGLDVVVPVGPGGLVDVDQIKYFSQNLGPSQKRQIRHSLEVAIATHEDPDSGYAIRQWRVTMPLDATRGLEAWLRETADELGAPFPVAVRGLLFVEALVTAYPEVVDYYVHNGAARVNELVADLTNLAGLSRRDDAGNRIEPDQAEEPLRRLLAALNRDDPHFRYEFQVSDAPPPMIDRPGLVCSAVNCGPDGCVTWHVFARYVDVDADRPVPLSLTLRPDRMTEQQRDAWTSAMTYGTDVELEGAGVAAADLDLPAGLGHSGEISRLRLGPARTDPAEATRARWAIKDPSGDELAALVFEFSDATTGVLGGERRLGHDPERFIVAELRSHFDDDGAPIAAPRIAIRLAKPDVLRGVPAQRALPVARFVGAWRAGNRLTVAPEFGGAEADAAVLTGDIAAPPWLPRLVEALAVIGGRAGVAMPLPSLRQVDPGGLEALFLVEEVLRGARAVVVFDSAVALVAHDDVDDYLASDEPRVLDWPLPTDVGGVPVALPRAVLVVEGADSRIAEEQPDDDSHVHVALTASPTTRAWIELAKDAAAADAPASP